MQSDISPQVVVVGGGMAGLTAACYLARAGVQVTLFERAAQPGGRAATRHEEGWAFNRGAHALYPGGAASAAFRELGVTYRYGMPAATYVLQQGRFSPVPASVLSLARARLGPGDVLELARLFAALPRLSTRSLAATSVQAWLEQTVRHPQVRALLTGIARTFVYSAALDLVSAELFVDKLQRVMQHPVQYIEGGWQSLVDALRAAAARAGAQIVPGARVAAVEQDAGRVQGVRLADGRFVPAAAVVIATRPQEALKLFEQGSVAALRAVVEQLVPAHLACLDVALAGMPALRHPVVFDLDQPRFLTTQSLYVQIAPEGGTLISTFKQLDPRKPVDPKANECDLEGLLDIVQPGWRAAEVKRQFLPQIEAAGALPLARTGGFAGRPGIAVPGLANGYLAGDWIGDQGFLVDASVASARQAAHQILRAGVLSLDTHVARAA